MSSLASCVDCCKGWFNKCIASCIGYCKACLRGMSHHIWIAVKTGWTSYCLMYGLVWVLSKQPCCIGHYPIPIVSINWILAIFFLWILYLMLIYYQFEKISIFCFAFNQIVSYNVTDQSPSFIHNILREHTEFC